MVLNKMAKTYETFRVDGSLPATYEVVYGHAWGAQLKQNTHTNGDIHIPISQIQGRKKT